MRVLMTFSGTAKTDDFDEDHVGFGNEDDDLPADALQVTSNNTTVLQGRISREVSWLLANIPLI